MSSDRRWWVACGALVLAGLAVRVAVGGAPGYVADVRAFLDWSARLVAEGPGVFYARSDPRHSLYPPGFLLVLWVLDLLLDGEALRIAIKLSAVPADLAIGVAAALWARPRSGDRTSLALAAGWLLSPVAAVAGAYWGQMDAIGIAGMLLATLAAGTGRWGLAGGLAGAALMVKLQFGLAAYVLGIAAACQALRTRDARPLLRFAVPLFAVVIALGLPFRASPLDLVELARRSAETFPQSSLFAYNVWALSVGFVPDRWPAIGGALLACGLVASVIPLWHRRDATALLGAGACAALAFYFLPTRAHERYILPALALLLPLVAVRPPLALAYAGLSLGALSSFVVVFVSTGYLPASQSIRTALAGRQTELILASLMLAAAVSAVAMLALPRPARAWAALRSIGAPRSVSAALPFREAPERRLLLVVSALKIAGIVLVLTVTGLSGFDLPKSAWSRASAWLLAGCLVIAVLRYGWGIIPRGPVTAAVGALVAANLLATAFAAHPYTALFGERGRYLGLSFVLDMAVLFVALAVACRRPRDWAWPFAAAAAAGALSMAYGAAQYAGADPAGWSLRGGRPFGTLGNADMFGHFLGALGSGAAAVALFARRTPLRIAAAALAAAATALIVVVATRGALLGLGGGALALAALYARERGGAALRPLALAAMGIAVALALALVATPLGARMATLGAGPELADRMVIWEGSARAFAARPLLGWGPDSLGFAFPRFRAPGTEAVHAGDVLVDQAHDWILHALATTGVIGLAALLCVIGTSFVALWRAAPRQPVIAGALLAASAAYWAHGLVTVEAVGVSWVPWVAAAGAAALGQAPAPALARPIPRPLIAAIAAAAVLLAASGGSAARANEAIWRSATAYRAGLAGPATDGANEALGYDPGRGEYWNYRGVARQLRGLWALAAADYEEARRRTPHQVNFTANLARARAQQALAGDASAGGAAAAYAAAREAVAIEPNLSSSHRALADVALMLGDPDLALRESIAAIRLDPRNGSGDATAAAAAAAHPDRPRARSLLGEAIGLRPSPVLASALAALQ